MKATCPRITSSRDSESSSPKLPQNSARENPRAVVGMISGTFTSSSRMWLSLELLFLAIFIAIGMPNMTSMATAEPAIRNDMPMDENSPPMSISGNGSVR